MFKKWINVFTILMMASVLLTAYFSYVILKHPYIGALVKIDNGEVVLQQIEPLTWADRNLEIGDEVVSINGGNPLDHPQLKNWNMLEQVETLIVRQADDDIAVLTVNSELDSQMVFQFIIPLIIMGLSFYCSHLIYKSYRKHENSRESSLLLIIFLFTFSLAYMCGGASARGDEFSRSIVIHLLLATPIVYLHFLHSYFKELETVWFSKKWIWGLYSAIPLNAIFMQLKVVTSIDGLLIKTINLGSFLIVFLICAILTAIGVKKISYKTQKYLIKVLMISNALAFMPFLILYVLPYVILKIEVFSPVFLVGFLLIIPFSLVYQFLATKIYDIEFIVGRLKYYSLIIIIPSVMSVILVIGLKSNDPAVYSIRTFVIFFIIMFITLYYKEVFDFKFKLNRFSEKFNYQDNLLKYAQSISVASNIYEVSDLLEKVLVEGLLIDKAYLIQVNKITDKVNNIDGSNMLSERYRDNIQRIKYKLGAIEEVEKGFVLNVGEAEGEIYMIIALSNINTPILTRDELQWLKNLASYTAVTLESFIKIEYLMDNLEELENKPVWLNKIIFNLEEKQRSDLAKDLHDSVLQDLLSMKRQLELLGNDKDVLKIIDGLGSAIATTRETCHELRPQILYDLGLDKALNKIVKQHSNEPYRISITTSKLDQTINQETQLNIYRIVQELLNNAKKHSEATKVSIIVVKIKEKIVIHYEDDGVGSDVEAIFNKENSMGLSGINERVNMLGGTIKIDTEEDKGFKVVIEV